MTGCSDRPWPVSDSTFAQLAIGGGGRNAVDQLAAAQRAKHVTFLSRIVAVADAGGHPQRQWAIEGRDLLASALQHDLVAAKQAVGHPSVGLWARQALLALDGQPCPGAEPGGLCAIAAAAAIRAGLSAEITIPVSNGGAVLPSLGVAAVPGPTAVARCADGQATVGDVRLPADPHVDAPGWSGLHRVYAGSIDGQAFDVLIDDIDPFRFPNSEQLPGHQPATSWAETLTGGWAVLQTHHPQIAPEVAAAVSVITPISGTPMRPVSASSPVVFGTVAMSRPADAVSCAETLIHEVQHMKLGALLDFLPLTEPDDGRRYYAPWRPDPRPLGGLLQGAYAYLGISGFWRQQRFQAGYREHGDTQFARWRAAANLAVDTMLASGGLSSAGEEFVSGMKRTLHAWLRDNIGASALASAEQAAREHRAHWEATHGPAQW